MVIAGIADQENPSVVLYAGSTTALHFVLTQSADCVRFIADNFSVKILRFIVVFSFSNTIT